MIKAKPQPMTASDLYSQSLFMVSPQHQSSMLSAGQNSTGLGQSSTEKKSKLKFGECSLPSAIWQRPTKPRRCYKVQTLEKIQKMKIEDKKKLMKFTKDLKLPAIYVQHGMLDP